MKRSPVFGTLYLGSLQPQRIHYPFHWPLLQRFVAYKYRIEVLTCKNARHQAHGGPAVLAVKRLRRCTETRFPNALNIQTLTVTVDSDAQRLQTLDRRCTV